MALPIVKILACPLITIGKVQFNSFDVPVFGNLYCHEQVGFLQAGQEISMVIEEHTIFGIKLGIYGWNHMFFL